MTTRFPSRAVAGLAVFAACLAAYLAVARPSSLDEGWDSLATRVLPFAILQSHRPTLDAFGEEFSRDRREIGYLENRRGHLVSHYPIGAALVVLPLDVPVYLSLRLRGRTSPRDLFDAAEKAEGPTAGIVCALAVLVLYSVLSRSESAGRAAAVALVFGLGTSMWAVASRQLWQHGPAVLVLLLGYFFLSRAPLRLRDLAVAGLCFGFLFGIRPGAIVFAAAGLAVAALGSGGRREKLRAAAAFAAGTLAAMAPFLLYNAFFFGSLVGGQRHSAERLAAAHLPEGFLGLFFSPNRGLLAFTPVALVGFAGMAIAFRQWRSRPLLAALSAACVPYALVHCAFLHWAGGWSFGPRYLIELLPILAIASLLAIRRMNRRWILAAWGLAAASLLVQLDGLLCFGASKWESRMEQRLEAHAWDWRHLELWEDFLVRSGMYRARARAEVLPREGFRVRWESARVPAVLERGRPVRAVVQFRNLSAFPWPDAASANLGGLEGVHAVRLSFRWLKKDSDALVTDYTRRFDLAAPLGPGESATLSVPISAPDEPGEYRLQFDLVQELVEWFQNAGAPPLILPIRVE